MYRSVTRSRIRSRPAWGGFFMPVFRSFSLCILRIFARIQYVYIQYLYRFIRIVFTKIIGK